MKNLLEFLLIHLVQHPEAVEIEEQENERGFTYIIHVHPEDIGRVIGKGGSIIQSIRNIAKIRAVKEGIRAQIILAEPDEVAGETAPLADENTAEVSADSE